MHDTQKRRIRLESLLLRERCCAALSSLTTLAPIAAAYAITHGSALLRLWIALQFGHPPPILPTHC